MLRPVLRSSSLFKRQKQLISKAALLASWTGSSKVTEWTKAVSEAERIVGYPTSFMSLRCLLSDELSNVAMQMRRLVGTKHPLLKTARRFVYDGSGNMQTRGLVVLLLSKTAGPGTEHNPDVLESMVSGIYPSQRSLAEITEMIHTAYLVHTGVVDVKNLRPSDGDPEDMAFGNKMAVLSGDFLLANASTALAQLYNTTVVELISSAIRDLMCAEFSKFRDNNGAACLPEGVTLDDWKEQTFLVSGSLLAKCCRSAMILGNHGENVQQNAYNFGTHLALAHQLHEDLLAVLKPNDRSPSISAVSAPVVQHFKKNPDDEQFKSLLPQTENHKNQIRNALERSGALEETKIVCREHGQQALEILSHFQYSEARTALENIVLATQTL